MATAVILGYNDSSGNFQTLVSASGLLVTGTISVTSESSAEATAGAPSYSEGQDAPLSQNLTGDLRVIAKQSGTWNIGTVTTVTGVTTVTTVTTVAAITVLNAIKGSANIATAQVTSTGSAATLVVARATRRSVLIRNTDAANSVWVGPATVTTGNGFLIKAGESVPFTWVGLIQVIDNGSHAVVAISDEYD